MNKAVITIQGSVIRIPCFNANEISYYSKFLRTKRQVFTIYYFDTTDEVCEFMERGN